MRTKVELETEIDKLVESNTGDRIPRFLRPFFGDLHTFPLAPRIVYNWADRIGQVSNIFPELMTYDNAERWKTEVSLLTNPTKRELSLDFVESGWLKPAIYGYRLTLPRRGEPYLEARAERVGALIPSIRSLQPTPEQLDTFIYLLDSVGVIAIKTFTAHSPKVLPESVAML